LVRVGVEVEVAGEVETAIGVSVGDYSEYSRGGNDRSDPMILA